MKSLIKSKIWKPANYKIWQKFILLVFSEWSWIASKEVREKDL